MADTAAANTQPQPSAEATEAEGPPEKKKHKKPKLSKEEKRRRKLLAAIALQKKLMREQLLREIALIEKAEKRGKTEWEGMLKDIKLMEFREEMKEWGKKTTYLIERKNEKIDQLMKNMEETNEMHERNFRQHMDQLEYLTNCHKTLRDSATFLYETQATQIVENFLEELSRTMEIQARIKANTENIIHASNVVSKNKLTGNYEDYMQRKFFEVCSEVGKRYVIRDRTVKYMRNLQDQLLLWIKQLQGDMVDVQRTDKYLYFMKRQQNYVKESTKLNEIEQQSQKTMTDLQQEILDVESNFNRQYNSLKLEHEYFVKVRSIIKSSITRNKQMNHERLLSDASESYRVINRLKEIVKTGELLLALAACCRKYKTEKEKVNPLSIDDEDPTKDTNFVFKLSFDLSKLLDISEEDLGCQMATIKHFWRNCSNIRYHNLMLMATKQKLEEENEQYRNIIRSLKKSDDVSYILESLQIKHLLT